MYLLKHPVGLTPVLCKNWEELYGAKAQLALVGADFWEEVQAEQVKGSGTYLMRLDEAHVAPYQPADHLIKEVYRMALEQQLYLPGAMPVLYAKEIAAVCSPHGYDLQTGFAIVYSLIRAEQVRTLYLDFSYYSGFFDI